MNISIIKDLSERVGFDVVERKGRGHPDTLADGLAERISAAYSQYCLKNFGVILHHNFDKIGLLGGTSSVRLGAGHITSPIRVLINGRVSTKFGNIAIPVEEIIRTATESFFKSELPLVDIEKNIAIVYNLSNASSPGQSDEEEAKHGTRRYWFEPRSKDDLGELKFLASNDTSLGVGSAPQTLLEGLVLDIERTLNSDEMHSKHAWLGSDIKILANYINPAVFITMCIPQIANLVHSLEDYKANLGICRNLIYEIARRHDILKERFELSINTRDKFDVKELYLTATGSSIESGDEGLVGRGNRINGLITPTRPMSMEGACGKNPVYHIGKLYYVAAQRIADEIYRQIKVPNEVYLSSQSGRALLDPWVTVIRISGDVSVNEKTVMQIVEDGVRQIPEITAGIVSGEIRLCH